MVESVSSKIIIPETGTIFEDEVCVIWKDLDNWINNFTTHNQRSNNTPINLPSLSGKLEDVESGIVCDETDFPFSSACTLCNNLKKSSDATTESQRKSRNNHRIRERSRKSNVFTIRSCIGGMFIFISVSFVILIFLLWLSRFFDLGLGNNIDRSVPNTVLNWWSPLPSGRSNSYS